MWNLAEIDVGEFPSTAEALDFSSGIGLFCFTPPMKSRVAALLMVAVLALAPPLFGGGKNENKASVTFHLETEATDNPKMIFPQVIGEQTRYFRRMPELGMKDIVSFSPFPSDAGEGFGIVFKLKTNASNRLAAVTASNQGRWLIAQVNGRAVDGVIIDKQVNDGFIVIWKGVTLPDVKLLDEELPRADEVNKKK
jgi:hypothetical protein